jgi:hypothetical protein
MASGHPGREERKIEAGKAEFISLEKLRASRKS